MKNLGDVLVAAGIVAIPLSLFWITGLVLIGERLWFWYRVIFQQERVSYQALVLYRQEPTLAQAYLSRHLYLPIARMFLQAMALEQPEPDELALALDGSMQAEVPVLRRFSAILETIITLSPLLGLLGTVLGLIRALSTLQLGDIGSTRITGVTGGISEALVSTALGLVVAIFTLFFANMFRGLYLRQLALMQSYAAQFELVHRQCIRHGSSINPKPSDLADLPEVTHATTAD